MSKITVKVRSSALQISCLLKYYDYLLVSLVIKWLVAVTYYYWTSTDRN